MQSSGNSNSSAGVTNSKSAGNSGVVIRELSKTNVYIRGLTQNTTDKELVNLCSRFGKILSTKAIIDKVTNKCRGFGFVDFETAASAEAALKTLSAQGYQIQMAKVDASQLKGGGSVANANADDIDPTNLYFANLPFSFKESDLERILARYGPLVSTRILRDLNGFSKGVGFARMETKEQCEKTIKAFNGTMLNGAKEPLLIKFADSAAKRRQQRASAKLWQTVGHLPGSFDSGIMIQNGLATQVLPTNALTQFAWQYCNARPLSGGYPLQAHQWMPQYLMQPAAHIPQVADYLGAPGNHQQSAAYPYIPAVAAAARAASISAAAGLMHPASMSAAAASAAIATGNGGSPDDHFHSGFGSMEDYQQQQQLPHHHHHQYPQYNIMSTDSMGL